MMQVNKVLVRQNNFIVFVVLFAVLLVGEAVLRISEERLSGDIVQIRGIPGVTREMEASAGETSILFLGNSLLNRAIDNVRVSSVLSNAHRSEVRSYKMTPDASALPEWYCIFREQFASYRHLPSILVVGFAWNQLSDQYLIRAPLLGVYFCDWQELNILSKYGMADHAQLLSIAAGKVSHVYANRDRIRNRILKAVIPAYEDITQNLNNAKPIRSGDARNLTNQYTYRLLTDFIELVAQNGTKLILVAMPVVKPYEIDPGLVQKLKSSSVVFYDMREEPGIDEMLFIDPIHLGENGQRVFSNSISKSLEQIVNGTKNEAKRELNQ